MRRRLGGRAFRSAATAAGTLTLLTIAMTGTGHAAPAVPQASWAAPVTVPGVATSAAPAIATCIFNPFMVWKGLGNDQHIYYSSYSERTGWAPQQQIQLGNLTDTAPSVSCDNHSGQVVVAWKGIGADQHVYTTTEGLAIPGVTWSAPAQVPGVLTDTSPAAGMVVPPRNIPAVTTEKEKPASPQTSWTPVPYLAWKDAGSASISFTSMVDDEWQAPATIPGAFTDIEPTMSNALGTIDVTWKVAGTPSMQYSAYDPKANAWSRPDYIGNGGTSSGVTTTVIDKDNTGFGGPLAVWKGIGSDQRLWYTTEANPPTWAPQALLPAGALTTENPATTVYDHEPHSGFAGFAAAIVVWRAQDSTIHYTVQIPDA